MAALPKRATERIAQGVKKFQPILHSAKTRDVNESDTVVIVTDVLHEVFGYDKYSEITSEHMIRGTFCDLAVKLDGKLAFLIEVKAIGLDLKEQFVKQAIDYAANQGVEWVALTNGWLWRVFRVSFTKPIQHEVVVDIDLSIINPRNSDHIETVGLLAKEGWLKAHLDDYHSQKQALSRFTIAALLMSDSIVDVLRREIRKLSPGIRIHPNEVRDALSNEVLKRDVLEGERATSARKQLARAAAKQSRRLNTADSAAESAAQDSVANIVGPRE